MMDGLLYATLTKVAAPALAIAVALTVTRLRRISWRDELGLRAPAARSLLLWLLAWIAWLVVSEVLIRRLGLDQAKPWPAYPPLIVALRILAIGLLGPLAEELVMRGVLLSRLRGTRLGPLGAIAVVAVLWAVMHVQYGAATLAMIFVDGLILGLARERGGSLWIPIAMHVLANLVSIAQSLGVAR
jgi:membrane protease YdiL (CAAX protease family)